MKRSDRTHYAELDVGEDATHSRIRGAFRRLALRHHPDRNPNNAAAEATFKQISAAYGVLADEAKRAQYDLELRAARHAEAVSREAPSTRRAPETKHEPVANDYTQASPAGGYAATKRAAASTDKKRHRTPSLSEVAGWLALSFFPAALLTAFAWVSFLAGLGLSVWAAVRWRKARRLRVIARIEAALEREQGMPVATPDNPWISAAIIAYALLFLLRAILELPEVLSRRP